MKHFFAPLIEPLGLLWLGLLVTAVVQLCRRRWRRLVVPLALLAFLSLVGNTSIAAHLLARIERPYAHLDWARLPEADAVVMLGGVLESSTDDAFGLNLGPTANRVLAAVELVRLGKARALVLGGGGQPGRPGPTESELLKHWLETWRVITVPVYALGLCGNTHDEALRTRELVQTHHWKSILLVSSGSHLRRATALFQRAGVPVTPVGADFQGLDRLPCPDAWNPLPRDEAFQCWTLYLHELVGWWVYRGRGWL